jgi:hypothetical protein
MVYKTTIRVFTTLIFAVSLLTFGIILGAPMHQWAFASTILASLSSELNVSVSQAPPVCEESGQGSNFSFCIDAAGPSGTITQSNRATASDNSNIDVQDHAITDIVIQQEVQCNESGGGDNNAVCQAFAFDDSFTSATNTATASGNSNIEQDNDAEFLQSQDQQLQCDESGAGDNNAVCQNTSIDTGSVFQANTATSSDDANIKQQNNATVSQTVDQQTSCNESGPGDNNAMCQNSADNLIGPLTQTDTATGNGNFNQGNNAKVKQIADQQNKCDQSGVISIFCTNDAFITDSVSQTNDGSGNGSFNQANNANVSQTVDQQNKCDQSGASNSECFNTSVSTNSISQASTATGNGSFDQGNSAILDHTVDQQNRCDQSGSNGAFCSNTASSFDTDFVLPITQTNNASGDGSFVQDNNVKVNQTRDQQNRCDQSGTGEFASVSCENKAIRVGDISQTNTATGDGNFDQANSAILDQTTEQQNNCDESEASSADCSNNAVNGATFSLLSNNNIISQTNTATGDGIFGQDNSAKVDQTTEQQNNCDESAQFLTSCSNVGYNILLFTPQTNTATGNGSFNQANNAKVDQTTEQQNNCDQSVANFVECSNTPSINFVVPITQTNTATGNGSFNQANNAKVDQTVDQQNKCDQSGALLLVSCDNFAFNSIEMSQTNDGSGNGSFNQANNAKVDQSAVDLNKCDQSGAGEFLSCDNFASENTVHVSQANTATGNGSFNQANNAKVDQSAVDLNKCDQSGAISSECSNAALNFGPALTQTSDASGDGNFDQANSAKVDQRIDQQNKCDQSNTEAAVCDNFALNSIESISQTNTATGDGNFDQANNAKVTQTTEQQNNCGDLGFGANNNACSNSATSTLGSVSQTNGQSLQINQNTEQNSHCNIDSACSNTATEDVEGINSGTVSQGVTQDNNCMFESATVADDGTNNGNANANQEIDQTNLCMFNSNCVNDASATGTDTSSSNTQSNKCFINSNCENTGVNNKTVCIVGSNCNNSGTDSQVIGVAADDCSSSDTGRTVCIGSLRFGGSSIGSSDPAVTPATTINPVQKTATSDSVPERQQQQQNALPIIDNGKTNNNNDAKIIPLSSSGITTTVTPPKIPTASSSASTHSSDVSNQGFTSDKNNIAAATTTITKDGNDDNNKQKLTTSSDTRVNHQDDSNAAAKINNVDSGNKDDSKKANSNSDSTKDDNTAAKKHHSITSKIGHSRSDKDHNTAKVHDSNDGSKKDDNTAANIDHAKKGDGKKDHSTKDNNTAAKMHDSITSKIGHSGSKKQ